LPSGKAETRSTGFGFSIALLSSRMLKKSASLFCSFGLFGLSRLSGLFGLFGLSCLFG